MSRDPPPAAGEIRTVVHVAREFGSLAGAGGVKDVTEGLCMASAAAGIRTHLFLPRYATIDLARAEAEAGAGIAGEGGIEIPLNLPGRACTETVSFGRLELRDGLTIHLVDARRFRYLEEGGGSVERRGIYQYTVEDAAEAGRPELAGRGHGDAFLLNLLLVKAVLRALPLLDLRPDVVHLHDGHAALLPVLAQLSGEGCAPALRHLATVLTIHNAGLGYHQETGDLDLAAASTGLPRDVVDRCLLLGSFDPLLAGGLFASAVNTVSENYARELRRTGLDRTTGWLVHTLAGQGVEVSGITNGVDPRRLDPSRPERLGLPAGFSVAAGDLAGKAVCKRELEEAARRGEPVPGVRWHGGLEPHDDAPLFTYVGRFAAQKGCDVMVRALRRILAEDGEARFLALGEGDPAVVEDLAGLAEAFPGRAALAEGYAPGLAPRVFAAGDFCLVPSVYEPCGLTDFLAQLMGNVPIVHRVGGLVKTVDGVNGLGYLGGDLELAEAIRRALALHREPARTTLEEIRRTAVRLIHEHFTWDRVLARKYLPLYREARFRAAPEIPF